MTSDAEIQTALPAFASGNVAVITGGASGIGLAAAKRFAAMGMKAVLADIGGVRLDQARQAVAVIAGDDAVLPIPPTSPRPTKSTGSRNSPTVHSVRFRC